MDLRLELVPLPVADVDVAKAFYAERLGFHVDHDVTPGEARVCQLTPPGSACSVVLLGGALAMANPGAVQGLHLTVDDLPAARTDLLGRGVELSEVQDMGGVLFSHFADPDGNTWTLQQLPG